MARTDENAVFERLAKQYAETYGEKLKLEALELERQNVGYITPRLDKKVRQIGKTGGRLRYATGLAALAAGLLLILTLPNLLNLNSPGITASAPEAPAAEAPAEAAPPAISSKPEPPSDTELLPLSFTLPDNFTVADKELDNGKSVYYLSDANLDDVVLTMERNPLEDIFAELKPMTINNSQAYYKYSPDFSVLAFEHDSVTYVLTCKYDVNTLIPLGEAIL